MTPTRVVHIHDVQAGDGHVFIGCGRGHVLGNPVRLNAECPVCRAVHRREAATLPCYRQLLSRRLEDPVVQGMLMRLHGRRLACHHAPEACHGDVLAAVVDALVQGGVDEAQRVLRAPLLVA